jgi:hypothetical protein
VTRLAAAVILLVAPIAGALAEPEDPTSMANPTPTSTPTEAAFGLSLSPRAAGGGVRVRGASPASARP